MTDRTFTMHRIIHSLMRYHHCQTEDQLLQLLATAEFSKIWGQERLSRIDAVNRQIREDLQAAQAAQNSNLRGEQTLTVRRDEERQEKNVEATTESTEKEKESVADSPPRQIDTHNLRNLFPVMNPDDATEVREYVHPHGKHCDRVHSEGELCNQRLRMP